jgi:ubiquinone/menaquinone biosynthesis C-methylase UbiE
MDKKLLTENELLWSPIVANNTMNRERKATGVNSYEKDIKLNPINFITQRQAQIQINWMDLCCGKGNALIETAKYFENNQWKDKITLTGIDLVDSFQEKSGLDSPIFIQTSLEKWIPNQQYDLITIVHGIHYLGDKIALITKAASALKPNGLFIGNLDLNNIQITDATYSEKTLKSFFKSNQIQYNARTKLIQINGTKTITNPFQYIGADDQAGPNYTGQRVVNSFYSTI